MGNVNSLPNKSDELETLMKTDKTYRECSLLCFTETWLNQNNSDSTVDLPGFTLIRSDRDAKASGKKKGGGLALFVNQRWCNSSHITVKEKLCCPDIELLAVALRPYYVPREFSHIITILVYIPPKATDLVPCDVLHDTVARIQTQHPEALVITSGDFNHVSLSSHLTGFTQFVNCPTRENKTLDLLYANVKEAYRATALPPLGRSDHNLVYLQTCYKPCVLRQPATKVKIRRWTPQASEALRDCFESTDWNVLLETDEDSMNIDRQVDCFTEYINFCRDTVIPAKTVRCFPNNKPWITSDIKAILNQKKKAFRDGDKDRLKEVQHELKRRLKMAKLEYKKKIERNFQHSNIRDVWREISTISGHNNKKKRQPIVGDVERADELNLFFNRFDTVDTPTSTAAHPSSPQHMEISTAAPSSPSLSPTHVSTTAATSLLSPVPFSVTETGVRLELGRLCSGKAAGPDGVCPRLLKDCAAQLSQPLHRLFNLSLQLGRVPALWKTSCIVPVPKTKCPAELNDYRPIALTSHIMKTLERLILRLLRLEVKDKLDSLQFAYKEHIGVDDAILYMLHRALSHLEEPGVYVRIMFFDFSNAFNLIQPSILKNKLMEMGVDPSCVSWITDYLTGRPQFVRLGNCVSGTLMSSTGAPQGTVLAPFLFTLYTSDFKYSTESCHIQKYSDDTAIVACIRNGQEAEYRDLISAFSDWSHKNCLLLNTSKTKEMIIDFRRSKPPLQPVNTCGEDIEVVTSYKYLGVHLDNKLDWSKNVDFIYKKGQSRLFCLRRLRSIDICSKMLQMFYQSVVASVLFYATVCWGGSVKHKDARRLNKLVKKAGSVVGIKLNSLEDEVERRTMKKVEAILRNTDHPLHITLNDQRNNDGGRLLSLRCRTERFRKSFIPSAIRLYNCTVNR